MDIKNYTDALRVVARQKSPADGMERVERHTRDYLRREITAVEEGIERALRAIRAEEQKKTEGEDWRLIEDYFQLCLQKFASVFEPRLRSE